MPYNKNRFIGFEIKTGTYAISARIYTREMYDSIKRVLYSATEKMPGQSSGLALEINYGFRLNIISPRCIIKLDFSVIHLYYITFKDSDLISNTDATTKQTTRSEVL